MNKFESLVKQYNDIKYQVKRLRLQQEELKELGQFPKCANLDGMPHIQGNGSSSVESYMLRLADLETRQSELEERLECLRQEITWRIDKLPNNVAKMIFEYKIFMGKGWSYISRKINYSESSVRRLFSVSLKYLSGLDMAER